MKDTYSKVREVKSEESIFIWTEAFNCAEILPPMLSSFVKHHDYSVHVFTTQDEFSRIPSLPNVYPSVLSDSKTNRILKSSQDSIVKGYGKGHLGTARIWSNLIRSREEEILIHIDADTIFLDDCISPLVTYFKQGADLVGTRRSYLNRSYRKSGLDGLLLDLRPDAVNTDLIAFKRDAIPGKLSPFLTRRIRGKRSTLLPVVDFFDPIVFQMIRRGKKIVYCDSPEEGKRSVLNKNSPTIKNRISFAAVGSGLNFFKNPKVQTSPGYRNFALASYSLFARHFLDTEIDIIPLEDLELMDKIKRLDKETWTLDY